LREVAVPTTSHKTTVDPAGSPVRVVTNAGVDSGAEQQVVTLADSSGAFHGVSGNPVVVTPSGTVVVGGAVDVSGSVVSVTGSTVAIAGTVPVSGPLTDAQLRATAVPVSGTFWQATQPVSGPLTDTQLRATAVPVTGTVGVSGTVPVSGPLTDTQLRASAVPIAGTVGVSGTVPVSGPLTDAQIRATALPVSGTFWQATQPVSGPLTDTQLRATAVPVSGPLTDAQLRATAVPVSTPRPATGALSNVAGTTTSGTILAANTARVGATIWNDSTAILYLRLASGTASASACTVKLIADAYYEVPNGYAGVITGVWASAAGFARVTELT
jgi:hypothetical protein